MMEQKPTKEDLADRILGRIRGVYTPESLLYQAVRSRLIKQSYELLSGLDVMTLTSMKETALAKGK